MTIETKVRADENPRSAQSPLVSDADAAKEAKETGMAPNKGSEQAAVDTTDNDSVPVSNPDEAQKIAEGESAQSDG